MVNLIRYSHVSGQAKNIAFWIYCGVCNTTGLDWCGLTDREEARSATQIETTV